MIISVAKANEAADALGVGLDTLTPDVLSKAYRSKAKECHPDHHGNSKLATWAKVDWAKGCLTLWLEQHPVQDLVNGEEVLVPGDCRACGGTGRVKIVGRRFGAPLTMACVLCKGLGTIIQDEDDHD